MDGLTGYGLALGQTALALLLAPGVAGTIRWLKARLQNRRGAPMWQPYFELRKLFGKEVVVSNNASWLFRAAPFIVFASTVAVTLLVPIIAYDVLVISNRFAGPLYRMRRSLRALGAGESVDPIHFRDHDFLQELAVEFNAVADRVEQLRRDLEEAQAAQPRDFQTWPYE